MHGAVELDGDARRLVARHVGHAAAPVGRRAHARVLRVAGDADAKGPPAPSRALPLALQTLVVGELQGHLESLGEIAAVVDEAPRRHERIVLARDQVAAPDLGRIDMEPLRE